MLKDKRVLMLISLLVSVGLWMFVMGEVDPVKSATISNVEVEMYGEQYLEDIKLKAVIVEPQKISVTIGGKRSNVNAAKKKGIKAYVDVSHCEYGRNVSDISIKMPNGVTGVYVESMSENKAVFLVE
ncbi:MAG: hypothetical protein ACOX4R_02330 [Lentihominibacter sp.]|jgi:hypothetical protein